MQIHHFEQPYFQVCIIEFDERKWSRGKIEPINVKGVKNHFVAQIAHQIDRQLHNSGILHELCMSMDVWVILNMISGEKVKPVSV